MEEIHTPTDTQMEVPLSLVLADSKLDWALRRSPKKLIHFFTEHSDGLIKYAFKSTDKSLQKSAYKVLQSLSLPNQIEICSSSAYQEILDDLIANNDEYQINKYVNLLDSVICKNFGLFENIVLKLLKSNYIAADSLLRTINTSFINLSETFIKECTELINLERFFIMEFLQPYAKSQYVLAFLTRPNNVEDFRYKSSFWKLVLAALDASTQDVLASLVGQAIEGILIDYGKLQEFQCSQITFIEKLIGNVPKIFEDIDTHQLFEAVAQKFEDFPNHSIGLKAISDFFITILSLTDYLTDAYNVFMPRIEKAISEQRTLTSVAYAINFINEASNESALSNELYDLLQNSEIISQKTYRIVQTRRQLTEATEMGIISDDPASLEPLLSLEAIAVDV